jgi:hypothetical protein
LLILLFMVSDGELAVSELGDLEWVVVGMVDSFRWLGLMVLRFVAVGGLAVLIRRAHIHKTDMFAGSASS